MNEAIRVFRCRDPGHVPDNSLNLPDLALVLAISQPPLTWVCLTFTARRETNPIHQSVSAFITTVNMGTLPKETPMFVFAIMGFLSLSMLQFSSHDSRSICLMKVTHHVWFLLVCLSELCFFS